MEETPPMYDKWADLYSIDKQLKMDYSRILEKPYLVGSYTWLTSYAQYSTQTTLSLPTDAIANALAVLPFNASTLYRAKMCVMIQVAGTPMHQGTLIAAAVPAKTIVAGINNINNMMAAPHALLFANASTSACIEVPFYYNSKLTFCDPTDNVISPYYNNNYCDFVVAVLNQLVAPATGATSLTYTVHVMFKDVEFYAPHIDVIYKNVPNSLIKKRFPQSKVRKYDNKDLILVRDHPHFLGLKSIATGFIDGFFTNVRKAGGDFLDWARGTLRAYTGLHNPNTPAVESRMIATNRNFLNIVDCKTQFEKLDPYTQFDRIVQNPVFDTHIDEMDMKFLLSKPYFLGDFDLSTSTPGGTILWSRPITPRQQILKMRPGAVDYYGTNIPLQKFHFLSRFWRGSLKIHIQASMTNFQFAKLTFARNYSPNINMLTKYPLLTSVPNLMTETFEFSGGGQIQTFELPYISPFDQLECTSDWSVNALQHGMYYIIANAQLVNSASVATSCQFNVYISAGDDFQFFGYAANNGVFYTDSPTINPYPGVVAPALLKEEVGEDLIVQDQIHSKIPEQTPTQSELTGVVEKGTEQVHTLDFLPIYSVRDYIRRLNPMKPFVIPSTTLSQYEGTLWYSVYSLLGGTNSQGDDVIPLDIISQMYLGYTGGLKFKMKVLGSSNVSVTFVPPGTLFSATALPTSFCATQPTADLSTFGNPTVNQSAVDRQGYYNTKQRYPPPGIEINTYVTSTPYRYSNDAYDAVDESSGDCSIIEGVIPNFSPLRFVGDIGKMYDFSKTKYTPPTIDMGHLVLTVTPTIERRNLDSGDLHILAVHVEPWVACTDEGRFGFQVLSPPMLYPQQVATGVGLSESIFNSGIKSTLATNYASSQSDALLIAPAAYYST